MTNYCLFMSNQNLSSPKSVHLYSPPSSSTPEATTTQQSATTQQSPTTQQSSTIRQSSTRQQLSTRQQSSTTQQSPTRQKSSPTQQLFTTQQSSTGQQSPPPGPYDCRSTKCKNGGSCVIPGYFCECPKYYVWDLCLVYVGKRKSIKLSLYSCLSSRFGETRSSVPLYHRESVCGEDGRDVNVIYPGRALLKSHFHLL